MAIQGLTHQGLSVPKIGMIKKGDTEEIEKTGKNGKYTVSKPVDLDYFRVEFDTGDEVGKRTDDEFLSVYGEKPRELRVTFHSDRLERVWEAYAEAYIASRLVARIDYTEELGQHFLSWFDLEKKDFIVQKRKPFTPYHGVLREGEKYYDIAVGQYRNQKGDMVEVFPSPIARLKVVLRDLPTFRLGYLLLNTGSKNDIANLDQQIRYYENLFKERKNGFAGVDFILRRRPYNKQTPFGRREIWLLSLEIDPDQARAEHAHMHRLSMPTTPSLPVSTPAIEETPELGDWHETDAGQFPEGDDYEDVDFDPTLIDDPVDDEVDAVEVEVMQYDQTLIDKLAAAGLGVKDPAKVQSILQLSKVLTPGLKYDYYKKYVGWWMKEYTASNYTDKVSATEKADIQLREAFQG